jgi:hypothetical protein
MPRNQTHDEPSYVWVLAEPRLLVRFDISQQGRRRSLGDMLLIGPVDSARLRALNLIRLTFLMAELTPMPKWPGSEPPSLSLANAAIPSVDGAMALWKGEEAPFTRTGLDWTESDFSEIALLYEDWQDGRPKDEEASQFLLSMFNRAHANSADETDQLIALGLQIVLPVSNRLVWIVGKSLGISENNARQVIHRLRNKGYLPASIKGRFEL